MAFFMLAFAFAFRTLAKNRMSLSLSLAISVPAAATPGTRGPGEPFRPVPPWGDLIGRITRSIDCPGFARPPKTFPIKSLTGAFLELRFAPIDYSKGLAQSVLLNFITTCRATGDIVIIGVAVVIISKPRRIQQLHSHRVLAAAD